VKQKKAVMALKNPFLHDRSIHPIIIPVKVELWWQNLSRGKNYRLIVEAVYLKATISIK